MAKKKKTDTSGKSKGTIIGAIGATMIGAAILLFVTTMILNNLKTANATQDDSDTFNTTVSTIQTILTVCVILLAVMGIVLIGSQMIAIIGGGWGG